MFEAEAGLGDYLVPALGFAIMASFWYLEERSKRRRSEAIRLLGQRHHLSWYDDSVPFDLPAKLIDGVSRGAKTECSGNIIAGMDGTTYRFSLDLRIGWGRHHYRRTVIGIRPSRGFLSRPQGLPSALKLTERDGWRIATVGGLFASRFLLKPETIEAYWAILDQGTHP